MSLTRYDTFLKVLELKSFSRAAEALGYTQSSVSQTVNQLENDFGFRLLVRKRNDFSLTREGEELLPLIRDAVECERRIEEKVSSINDVIEGTVNVGAYQTISCTWIPNIIRKFNELHPGISINLYHGSSALLEDLLGKGKVDCCLMDIPESGDYESHFIYKDKYKVVLPDNHPESKNKVFRLSELEDDPLSYVREGRGYFLFGSDNADSCAENNEYYTTDDNVFLSMVEQGIGIGLISEMALSRNPYRVKIVDTDEPVFRDLGIVVKDMKKLSSAAREFVSHVINNDYYI